jgi:hypothetical protein
MRTLAAGFRALSHGKLILLLAVSAAVVGLLSATPLHYSFGRYLGGTLAGEHFLTNHPTFAPMDFVDFGRENPSLLSGITQGSRAGVLLTVLLQAFFAGGIVAVLGRGRFTFGQFFEPARRNFWHNVKCLLLFVLLLVVVYGAVFGGAFAAGEKLFENVPPDAGSRTAWDWGLRILALLVWGVLSLLYDFARAARRHSPAIGAWRAWGFARRALRGSWARALVLFLFWLVLGAAAWFGAFAFAWSRPAQSVAAIGAVLVLQFLVMCVRAAVRVAAWGSYLEFLDHRAAGALAPAAPMSYVPVATVSRSL